MADTTPKETQQKKPWVLPKHPSPDDIDWDLIDRLCADRTLIDLGEVATMCGLAHRQHAWKWVRPARNYLVGHYRQWPPPPEVLLNKIDFEDDGRPPGRYFTHRLILPPPDFPGRLRGKDRWYKGTIYGWGMRVHRISITGEPIPAMSGPGAGRGPVRGRVLKNRKNVDYRTRIDTMAQRATTLNARLAELGTEREPTTADFADIDDQLREVMADLRAARRLLRPHLEEDRPVV